MLKVLDFLKRIVNKTLVAITGLESTCTVLGLTDTGLFWTRVHPSGMIQRSDVFGDFAEQSLNHKKAHSTCSKTTSTI